MWPLPRSPIVKPLRDISRACLSAQSAKLYHMGFRGPVHRSTLSDANEARDWRIYAEFAQRLIAQARRLYADATSWTWICRALSMRSTFDDH